MFIQIRVLVAFSILVVTGCALQTTTIRVDPVYGMSLKVPVSMSKRIEMNGDYGHGISLYGEEKIEGSVHVSELPENSPKGLSAINFLIKETAKNDAPIERLDLGPQAAGYAVHIDDFSTIWVVTRDNPSSLVIISIRTRYFDNVVNSLAF